MTEKSAPAMARMVPPFSVYGLNWRCWGWEKEPSGIVFTSGGDVGRCVGDGLEQKGGRPLEYKYYCSRDASVFLERVFLICGV